MDEKNVLISVYTNASGFLWSIMKVDSGTDLGWSEYRGDCEWSGSFTSYENALEDALNLVAKGDLDKFQKDCPKDKFHWSNYADWLQKLILNVLGAETARCKMLEQNCTSSAYIKTNGVESAITNELKRTEDKQ